MDREEAEENIEVRLRAEFERRLGVEQLKHQIAPLSEQLASKSQIEGARKEAEYEHGRQAERLFAQIQVDRQYVFMLIERLVPQRLSPSDIVTALGRIAQAYTLYSQETRQDDEDIERETSSSDEGLVGLVDDVVEWVSSKPLNEQLAWCGDLPEHIREKVIDLLAERQRTPPGPTSAKPASTPEEPVE